MAKTIRPMPATERVAGCASLRRSGRRRRSGRSSVARASDQALRAGAAPRRLASVSSPARQRSIGDQWLLVEPIGNNTGAIMTIQSWQLVGASTRSNKSGTAPHRTNDAEEVVVAKAGGRAPVPCQASRLELQAASGCRSRRGLSSPGWRHVISSVSAPAPGSRPIVSIRRWIWSPTASSMRSCSSASASARWRLAIAIAWRTPRPATIRSWNGACAGSCRSASSTVPG